MGARTAIGAPAAVAAVQLLRRTAEVRIVFHTVRKQRVNAKVCRFLHGAGHYARRGLQKVFVMLYREGKTLLLNILSY